MKRVVCILLMVLFPSVAFAATDANPPAAAHAPAWISSHHDDQPDPPPPPASSRLRSVLCAFMVLSLIGFAVYSKMKKKTLAAKNPTAYVKVSDSVKVGEKAHLVVATIGKRTMVLGVTEHGIRRLVDVDRASEQKMLAAAPANHEGEKLLAPSLKTRFQTILQAARRTEIETAEVGSEELPPGAVSQPMLRVANDTQDRFERRVAISHPPSSLQVEEQVTGLLAARARRI